MLAALKEKGDMPGHIAFPPLHPNPLTHIRELPFSQDRREAAVTKTNFLAKFLSVQFVLCASFLA